MFRIKSLHFGTMQNYAKKLEFFYMNLHKKTPDKSNDKSNDKNNISTKFRHAAETHIAPYPNLHHLTGFPPDLWQKMAENHLFGIRVDTAYKGYGGSFAHLRDAGKQLVIHGETLGVAMSWLVHEIVGSWLLSTFATDAQKTQWLPDLAAGRKTACFAVSEPKVGAHPKHLAATAEKTVAQDLLTKDLLNGYLLNGEKTYLTNSPMADYFVVIAITGKASGKNQFSAFMVSKDTPGLEKTGPLNFPFLRPCGHGGIRLTDCRVSADQVLGEPGRAYEQMVVPFRTVEDTLMTGPITGGLRVVFAALIRHLSQRADSLSADLMQAAGELQCCIEGLDEISRILATELDRLPEQNLQSDRLLSIGLFFRMQAIHCLEKIKPFFEHSNIAPDTKAAIMVNDLSALMRIAENGSTLKLKKIGRSLLFQGAAAP